MHNPMKATSLFKRLPVPASLAKKNARQLANLYVWQPDEQEMKKIYEGSAYEMLADCYGEQAYEMRANDITPPTFKQFILRQLGYNSY